MNSAPYASAAASAAPAATDGPAHFRALETVVREAPVGFCFLDRERRFSIVNPSLAALNGQPVDAHLGRHVSEIVPTLMPLVDQITGRIEATGNPEHVEFWGETPAAPGVRRCWSEYWYPVADARGELLGFGAVVQEITARRLAEEGIAHREAQFRALLGHAPLGMFLVDADFVIREVNPVAASAFRIPGGIEGRRFEEVNRLLWSPPFADEVIAIFRRTLETGVSYEQPELAERRADRDVTEHYRWQVHRITDSAGRYALVCYFEDIGDRVRTRDALAEWAERFRRSHERSLCGFTILRSVRDERGTIVDFEWQFVNEEAARLLQRPARTLLGRRLLEVLPENQHELFPRYVRVVETGEPLNDELHYRGEGIRGWFRNMTVRLDDGIAVTFLDVTAQRDAEEALKAAQRRTEELLAVVAASEDRLKLATEGAGVGSWELDLATGHGYWSPRGMTLMGAQQPQFTVKNWVAFIHPEDRERVVATWTDSVRLGAQYEVRFRSRATHGAGSPRWVLSRGRVERAADGTPLRAAGVLLDITAEMESSAALAASERRARSAEEQLREADRRKDDFLATLAHELRNPMAPILNGLAALDRIGAQDDAARQTRAMMSRHVEHLVRLVDDLLDISRITRGKIELRRENVELTEVLRQAHEATRHLLARRVCNIEVPAPGITVDGDRARLTQIFVNLLSNAARFTREDGRVAVEVAATPAAVSVTVHDDGIGIPPDQLDTIFEMFTQLGTPSEGGLGIGLALVKQLVALHDGTVTVASRGSGTGAAFTVTLPRATTHARGPTDAPVARAPARRRILVVDDNRDAADSMQMLLGIDGNDVVVAYDGAAALRRAAEFQPDVILLDLGMPGMDGYETCRRLREEAWSHATTIIALTGWGQDSDRSRTRAAGFNQHLVKPLKPADLYAALASA